MDIPVAENFAEVTSQNMNEETDSILTQDVLHSDLCKLKILTKKYLCSYCVYAEIT